MTIGIGLVASEGIVIAADREEGDGYLKNDFGKISASFKGTVPIGSIGVTGAGSGPCIDEVAKIIRDGFCTDTGLESTVETLIRKKHLAYYRQSVLPLKRSAQPPDYALIIGCCGDHLGKRIWFTSELATNVVDDYVAVGIGASVANGLLGRLYDRVPVKYAVKLAAYIIYRVKESVSQCGFGTDIVVIERGLPRHVPPGVVREWEDAFRSYATMERNAFYYCIGLETQEQFLYRTRLGKDLLSTEVDELRKVLTRLDSSQSPTTPSASQTSEDQQ